MSIRDEYLTTHLKSYLARRSMPRGLDGKPDAINDEMAALIQCLFRCAPRDEIREWWDKFIVRLAEDAQTRAWPTENEIRSAAKAISRPSDKRPAQGDEIDTFAIHGRRMENGETVGDEWFYGRNAVELQARGLVTPDTLRKYRSAFYFHLKDTYGEDEARAKETEMLRRQGEAETLERTLRKQRDAAVPAPKRITAHEWDGAQ